MANTEYQSRYLAYCTANGKEPEAMLAHDRERYPGGVMCGYLIWIGEQWREWKRLNNRKPADFISNADHDAFDQWLGAA